jgi:hypothetical protein
MSEAATSGSYRLRPDSKGRVTLGKLAEGVSSYVARRQEDGKIILEPFIEIPAGERWLHENAEAMASVRRGIGEAKAGRLKRASLRKRK